MIISHNSGNNVLAVDPTVFIISKRHKFFHTKFTQTYEKNLYGVFL